MTHEFLKDTLGVKHKHTTTNWAVLKNLDTTQCSFTGSSMLSSYIMMALMLGSIVIRWAGWCWNWIWAYIHVTPAAALLQVLDPFQGLRRCDSFVQAVRQKGTCNSIQEFTGEVLRDWAHRTQIASWRHVTFFLQCHLVSMCVACSFAETFAFRWAVLRECGHEPLPFYWFISVVKVYNSSSRSVKR